MNLNSALTLAHDLTEMDGQPRWVVAQPEYQIVTHHQLDWLSAICAEPNPPTTES